MSSNPNPVLPQSEEKKKCNANSSADLSSSSPLYDQQSLLKHLITSPLMACNSLSHCSSPRSLPSSAFSLNSATSPPSFLPDVTHDPCDDLLPCATPTAPANIVPMTEMQFMQLMRYVCMSKITYLH